MGSVVPVQRYHRSHCTITEAELTAFLDAPVDGTLTQVPGINQATVPLLNAAGIMNSIHLIGDYLTMCEIVTDAETGEHLVDVPALKQKFWLFLETGVGIRCHHRRSDIVKAISSKVATCIPGFIDTSEPVGHLDQ